MNDEYAQPKEPEPQDQDPPSARREALTQALANTRISGHQPTLEFLTDCERVVLGEMLIGEALAASLARAKSLDQNPRCS